MSKKKINAYYRNVLQRKNLILEALMTFFLGLASRPRIVLEVFIRKNFGERYFNMASALTAAFFLTIIPLGMKGIEMSISHGRGGNNTVAFLLHYLTWYAAVVVFVIVSYRRQKEIQQSKSVFDFGKYSKYSGDFHPRFVNFKINGQYADPRKIETLLEPGFFLAIGIGLSILGQRIGIMISIVAVLYSLSYFGAYYYGDQYVMDKIDELILNEDLEKVFIDGEESDRGVRFYGKKPTSKDLREKVYDSFFEEDDDDDSGIAK